MKVVLLNGSPNELGCTYTALSEVAGALKASGVDSEMLWIGKSPISGCVACYGCAGGPKGCVIKDSANDVAAKITAADGLIVGSPVYYAKANGSLCALLDRVFFSTGRYYYRGKPAAAIVSCRRGGATAAFDNLNKYFSNTGMPMVSSQYWNMVHGSQPDEVKQDLEGLQTMRTLGQHMAWMIKCIKAGKEAGIDLPELEKRVWTNFIR